MLPDFDKNGNLPDGIYKASIDEVLDRFGHPTNRTRPLLNQNLRVFYDFISSFAIFIFINGSYITSKIAPNDVDLALCLPENFISISDNGARLTNYIRNKTQFRLHIFPYKIISGQINLMQLIREWRIDRNKNPKGIIRVEIK